MKTVILITCVILLVAVPHSSHASPPTIVGVGGLIILDGQPADGISVTVLNNNTGSQDTSITENGWYAAGITARDGNIISISVTHRGETYWNTTRADTSRLTQFCNLTIGFSTHVNATADAGGPYRGMEGTRIYLDGSGSTGDILSYRWTVNGVEKQGKICYFILDDGNYTAILTITTPNGTVSDQATITVDNDPPYAHAGDMYTVTAGDTLLVDGSRSTDRYDSLTYQWDWTSDGTWDTPPSDTPTATHTYTSPGVYTLSIRVYDGDAYATASALVVVGSTGNDEQPSNQQPLPLFTHRCDNLTVHLDGSPAHDPDGYITDYHWNLGDGTTINGIPSPSHTYESPGTYTVTLTVTDDEGAHATSSLIITVDVVNRPPIARFTHVVTNATLTITSTSYDPDGDITAHVWNISGICYTGSTVTMPAIPGTYTVILMVADNDGSTNTTSSDIHIGGTGSDTVTLSFTITDGTHPISDAAISVGTYRKTTNSTGIASFTISPGNYTISISRRGYITLRHTALVTEDENLTITMTRDDKSLMPLPPIITIASLSFTLILHHASRKKDRPAGGHRHHRDIAQYRGR